MGKDQSSENTRFYRHISILLFIAFFLLASILILLNLNSADECLAGLMSPLKIFLVQLYFWAALGATVASYRFFAADKDLNERESLKEKPDPQLLRYPDGYDVVLYAQRILFSGVLGVIGAIIVLAGLGYFDAKFDTNSTKEQAFFVVFVFLVGLYQNEFLGLLAGLRERLFHQKTDERTGHENPADSGEG